MKRCPECGRTFTNSTLLNCLNDGTALMEDVPTPLPYFGAAPAAPPNAFETPPNAAETPDTPAAKTYTDMPLSAIPELQSPEMQAALKEALDKAGMSGLLDAGSAHSTVSIKTSVTTGQSGTPFFFAGVPPAFPGAPPPGYAPPLSPSDAAAPRRQRSPWGIILVVLLGIFALITAVGVIGFRALRQAASETDVPADIAAAVKNADAAEASAVRTLDPRPLASAYTGPALAQEVSRLMSLRAASTTVDEQLLSQEFRGYQAAADGSEAKVDVTETWNTTTYAEPGHTLVGQKSGDVNPQTVYLAHTPSGWRVEKIVFHHF